MKAFVTKVLPLRAFRVRNPGMTLRRSFDWRPSIRPSDKAWASRGPLSFSLLGKLYRESRFGILCHSVRGFEQVERPITAQELLRDWNTLHEAGVDRYFVEGICSPPPGYRLLVLPNNVCFAIRPWHGPSEFPPYENHG